MISLLGLELATLKRWLNDPLNNTGKSIAGRCNPWMSLARVNGQRLRTHSGLVVGLS